MMKILDVTYNEYPKEPVELENLSIQFMKQALFVPLSLSSEGLEIAMADPMDYSTIDALKVSFGLSVNVRKGRPEEISDVIDRLYGSGKESMESIIEEADKDVYEIESPDKQDVESLKGMASEAPIIRLVNRLIYNAVGMHASDIHFEPFEKRFVIRYRVDGVLHEIETPPLRLQAAIISRVKIMAKLDIAERRLPQDGGIKLKIADKEIDFQPSPPCMVKVLS